MEELKKKLEAFQTELQDIMKKVGDEIDNFESDDESESSPWEDTNSYLNEANDSIDNALNSWPAE